MPGVRDTLADGWGPWLAAVAVLRSRRLPTDDMDTTWEDEAPVQRESRIRLREGAG